MISPNEDKKAIKAILESDPYTQRAGFKKENIKTTGASSSILSSTNPELQIFISIGQPEKNGQSEIVKNMTYDVSVSGKRNFSNKIDSVVEQVIALLEGKEIGRGNILYLLDAPMELASDPAVYVVEMTFLCQSTIFNPIRK